MATYITIAWGAFFFCILTIILSPIGMRYDRVKRRIDSVTSEDRKEELLDEDLSKPLFERFIKPVIRSLASKLQKILPNSTKNSRKKQQDEKLKKMLQQAGLSINASEYSIIRLIVIIGTALLSGAVAIFLDMGMSTLLVIIFGAYTGYVIMRFHLTSNITKRRKAIEQQMPDILDMLSISVEAGLGFEQAIAHVIGHYDGCLIDELTITFREMSMGRTRRDALTLFSERCGLNEIKTFVGAVIQAEQLGISLKNVLRSQAAAMRASRRARVEEKAMKVSVKMLMPMVIFILPVLLIVLMGPAAVTIINQFGG